MYSVRAETASPSTEASCNPARTCGGIRRPYAVTGNHGTTGPCTTNDTQV
jgi:hypothetical protein